jgi:flagellar hook assembly protein FlgD
MPVLDKKTEQPNLAGKLVSRGLVIGSRDFQEYVRNYPNPFGAGREVTRITYFMDSPGEVSIKIYALTGELVYEKTYSSGEPQTMPGPHEEKWDGRNMRGVVVRNGIYICRITAGGKTATIKIAVAK